MKTIKILSAISLVSILFSCSDDNQSISDTEKPTIDIISPSDNQEFHPGEDLVIVANFSDNQELASFKIDIHYTSDDHSHDRIIFNEDTNNWSQQIIGELSDKNYLLNQTIQIPQDATNGVYHLGIYALDKTGNQSLQWKNFEIHNH